MRRDSDGSARTRRSSAKADPKGSGNGNGDGKEGLANGNGREGLANGNGRGRLPNGNGRLANGNGRLANGNGRAAAQLQELLDGVRLNPPQAPWRRSHLLSIVVPTRHEAGNVDELGRRLEAVVPGCDAEIVFVDDSDDETPEAILALAGRSRRPVRLVHRPPGRRSGGLSGAVVEGMRQSQSTYVCVMDADLQHPPELIERMLATADRERAGLVVASRFTADGDAEAFGPLRALTSWSARMAVRAMFPTRLRSVSDPMSGFFLVRRSEIDIDSLRPRGFKILLEIAARTPDLRIAEVPLQFGKRFAGHSKATLREGVRFLRQLLGLRFGAVPVRISRFGVVGATGLVVNTLVLAAFASLLGAHYLLAALIATQASSLWNFVLTERWVFGDRQRTRRTSIRLATFFAVNNAAMGLRAPLLVALTTGLGIHYLLSNALTLLAFAALRYVVADGWIWAGPRRVAGALQHTYDIHGIVSVASEVRLPELARFRTEGLSGAPTITVRIGTPSAPEAPVLGAPADGVLRKSVAYREQPAGLGFACEIGMGGRFGGGVRIVASPLLRRSPHVLYTNVVEPVLRWTFAQRGYALVHAACVASGDRAFLITARTDTGKTTTCLKTLDSQPYGFVSDDLTLIAPDGRVLSFPKPLTISRHTLRAVRKPLLTRRQRLGLILQSRLHSRSGRQFALKLARSGLPMATINAITQMLVPPPKYQVDRLVPGVRLATETRLAGLVVIQRGGDEERVLDPAEAIETLLENCDDAYGFPPYPSIEAFLHSRNGLDLKAVERRIVATALGRVPARLVESSTMDWWRRLPAIVESRLRTERAVEASASVPRPGGRVPMESSS